MIRCLIKSWEYPGIVIVTHHIETNKPAMNTIVAISLFFFFLPADILAALKALRDSPCSSGLAETMRQDAPGTYRGAECGGSCRPHAVCVCVCVCVCRAVQYSKRSRMEAICSTTCEMVRRLHV